MIGIHRLFKIKNSLHSAGHFVNKIIYVSFSNSLLENIKYITCFQLTSKVENFTILDRTILIHFTQHQQLRPANKHNYYMSHMEMKGRCTVLYSCTVHTLSLFYIKYAYLTFLTYSRTCYEQPPL